MSKKNIICFILLTFTILICVLGTISDYEQKPYIIGSVSENTQVVNNSIIENKTTEVVNTEKENNTEETIEEPVVVEEETPPIIEEKNLFTQTDVNVRAAATIESEIITVLSRNSSVVKIGDDGDWSIIKTDGGNAYIKSSLLGEEKVIVQVSSRSETEERENTSNNTTYLGKYKITAYCGCARCCGKAGGRTASGVYPTAGVTIAAPSNFAFGTQLIINGHTYTVQDRGGAIKGKRIDMYFNSHSEALAFGSKTLDVYQKN